MANNTGTTYFQYISNRSEPFGPQVFFWFTNQGGSTNTWLQLITDYNQAGQIADWLMSALNGQNPAPLNLNLSAGGTLGFSSTGTAVTINGNDGSETSLNGTFSLTGFGLMLLALVFSIKAMVQAQDDILQEAANHPLVKKIMEQ